MPSTPPAKPRSDSLRTLLIVAVSALAAFAANRLWLQWNSPHAPNPATDSGGCIIEARAARDYYYSKVHPFYNPPYDMTAWGAFRSELEKRVSNAELKCSSCFEPPCNRARTAMNELKTVIAELDAAVRSGAYTATPNAIVIHLRQMDEELR